MEFKSINPFSEEFLKDKEIDDNIKRQNSNDSDIIESGRYQHLSWNSKGSKNQHN